MSTDSAVQIGALTPEERELVVRVNKVLSLLADLSRADALVCVREGTTLRVTAHARPHSIAPAHSHSLVGEALTLEAHPTLYESVLQGRYSRLISRGAEWVATATQRVTARERRRTREMPDEGAPVQRETFLLACENRPAFGLLVIDTNLLEKERLRRRSRVFQQVVRALKLMATRGEPAGADEVSPFLEFDGLIFADYNGVIRYMSGIATNLYRNIGYTDSLIGRPLTFLETIDAELARQALETRRCVERAVGERGREWVKKAIPIYDMGAGLWPSRRRHRLSGVLIAVHDDTETRERARELQIKTTMIKEVHHRVKNDLQTLAALLRMQARRVHTEETRAALGEAVNRILSIAVIHEFLSEQDSRIINIRDIAQRILNQMQAAILDPSRGIQLKLKGPNIYLPARQATSCALVINELLQNALEHGYDQRASGGTISLWFEDYGNRVRLCVHDDGRGLPEDFDIHRVDSLGLRIVRMLVMDDLKGTIEMRSDDGVSAIVDFPKIPLGGEEGWNERE